MFLMALPFLVSRLIYRLSPSNEHETALLLAILSRGLAPNGFQHIGRRTRTHKKRWIKYKHKPVSSWQTGDDANRPKARTYLFPLAWASFRIGCCVETQLRLILK
jgi:hypothetical protein